MAASARDRWRIAITQGNLDNNHIYITELLKKGAIPPDVFGNAQAVRGQGKKVTLDVVGVNTVFTDVPRARRTESPEGSSATAIEDHFRSAAGARR